MTPFRSTLPINRELSIPIDDNGASATGTITHDGNNVSDGDSVTIGTKVYTFLDDGPGAGRQAAGLITSSGSNVSDGATITIGAKTYRFKATPAQINDVDIGSDAEETLANLKAAINGGAGEGTAYFTGTTANEDVEAGSATATTLALEGIAYSSDAIALTQSGTTNYTLTPFAGGLDTDAVGQVIVGESADESLNNLAALINDGYEQVQATDTLVSDETNADDTDTITIGDRTYTLLDDLSGIYASATLTSDETNVADGATVTIGTVVYTFKTSLNQYAYKPYRVLIGADADESLANLVHAINGTGDIGTHYSVGTVAHPDVVSADVDTHAIVVSARVPGVAGNSIAKAETSTHLEWDAGGSGEDLSGGVATTANEIHIGEDAAGTVLNIFNALTGGGTPGVDYSYGMEVNEFVDAVLEDEFTIALTANEDYPGYAGNTIVFTLDATHLSSGQSNGVLVGGVTEEAPDSNVTSSEESSNAITLTSRSATYAANAIALDESSSVLTKSGTTLSGGGSTIGTSEVGGVGGRLTRLTTECPQFAGTPTYTIGIYDANGNQLYLSSAQNENATVNTALELALAPTDVIKITTNAKVEETLPVTVILR